MTADLSRGCCFDNVLPAQTLVPFQGSRLFRERETPFMVGAAVAVLLFTRGAAGRLGARARVRRLRGTVLSRGLMAMGATVRIVREGTAANGHRGGTVIRVEARGSWLEARS